METLHSQAAPVSHAFLAVGVEAAERAVMEEWQAVEEAAAQKSAAEAAASIATPTAAVVVAAHATAPNL